MKKTHKVLLAVLVLMLAFSSIGVNAASDLETFVGSWGSVVKGDKNADNLLFTFDDIAEGSSFMNEASITNHWTPARGNSGDANHDGLIVKEGTAKVLKMGPFTQMVSKYQIKNRYIFELDYKATNQFFGMFVRTTGETYEGSHWYEADGSSFENAGLGSSGLYIMPGHGDNKIFIFVKTFKADNSKKLDNVKFELELEGVNFNTGFQKISIADDGSVITIFVNGKKVATVEMSGEATYEIANKKFFNKAVVKKADGTQLGTVDNALLSKEFSVPALGLRINAGFIDNISIREYAAKAEPNTETGDNTVVFGSIVVLMVAATALVIFKKKAMN